MELFTREILNELRENSAQKNANQLLGISPKPVLKVFDPCGAASWLLTELDEDGCLFGLCDLGMGFPELGYVTSEELENYRGPLGLGLERDIHFKAELSLVEYADQAREKGRIAA